MNNQDPLNAPTLGTPKTATVTIDSDENALFAFSSANYSTTEGAGGREEGSGMARFSYTGSMSKEFTARRLDVRRTPTVLVLDPSGRVVRRASGQPRPVDVIAALGAVADA